MPTHQKAETKSRLHQRNKNRERYDISALVTTFPALSEFVIPNKKGEDSIDFASPKAVKLLNQALLSHYYGIGHWDFPDGNLCPPIPGRADYIHYIADLLSENNFGQIPKGEKITIYDIGTGANCIYPIIGSCEYNWGFIASDIDPLSIASAEKIITENMVLHNNIEIRFQPNAKDMFYNVLEKTEKIDVTICNPPFHVTTEEAKKGTQRKVENLSGKKTTSPDLNFAGISNELIYEGGEHRFIHTMLAESKKFTDNILWFTTLVSKQSNLKSIYKSLDKLGASEVKTIPMGTGNKTTRIVAWTFKTKEEQKAWRENKWS